MWCAQSIYMCDTFCRYPWVWHALLHALLKCFVAFLGTLRCLVLTRLSFPLRPSLRLHRTPTIHFTIRTGLVSRRRTLLAERLKGLVILSVDSSCCHNSIIRPTLAFLNRRFHTYFPAMPLQMLLWTKVNIRVTSLSLTIRAVLPVRNVSYTHSPSFAKLLLRLKLLRITNNEGAWDVVLWMMGSVIYAHSHPCVDLFGDACVATFGIVYPLWLYRPLLSWRAYSRTQKASAVILACLMTMASAYGPGKRRNSEESNFESTALSLSPDFRYHHICAWCNNPMIHINVTPCYPLNYLPAVFLSISFVYLSSVNVLVVTLTPLFICFLQVARSAVHSIALFVLPGSSENLGPNPLASFDDVIKDSGVVIK